MISPILLPSMRLNNNSIEALYKLKVMKIDPVFTEFLRRMDAIRGKSAIVFGGVGGIAREVNNLFLRNGILNLVLIDIQEAEEYVVDLKVQYRSCNIFYKKKDISKKSSVTEIFKRCFEKLGYIDIVVNCAGIMNEQEVELTYQVNILGPIYTCLEALNFMGKHKAGRGGLIINVSSVAALGPVGGYCPIYASTKYALLGFSRCLMEEINFEMTGVKVIVLCPGATITPMVKDGVERMTRFPETLEKVGKLFENISVQGPEKVADTLELALKDQSTDGEQIWLSLNGTSEKIDLSNNFIVQTP